MAEIVLTMEQLKEKYKIIYSDECLAQYVKQFFDLSIKGDVEGAIELTKEVFKHHTDALPLVEPFIEAEYNKRQEAGEDVVDDNND